MEGALELLTEDVVLELPFRSDGGPRSMNGADARAFFRALPKLLIRQVGADQHWEQFEKAWTALLSYRYLGKLSPGLDAGVERETMPLRADMRNAVGGIMAAPLCIAAPEPYWLDDQCVPAPVVMSY